MDDNGLVSAIGSGTAVIKCYTSNGKSASCSVTVKSEEVSESEVKEGFSPYLVKLYKGTPYYSGPDYSSEENGKITKTTVYTIVAEEHDESGNKWGKLKSGVGWVRLSD